MNENKKKEISLVISAYNEEQYILQTVNKFYNILLESKIKFELLVFDDGSKDKTYFLIKNKLPKSKKIKVYKNTINSGLGYTLKKGAKVAKYKNITLFPGDNSYKVSGIKNLIKSLNKKKLLVGYRTNYIKISPWFRKISSISLRLISIIIFKKYLKDVHGPVIYKTKILKNYKLKSLRYNYSLELLKLFISKNNKILYIPYEISKSTIKKSNAFNIKNIIEILKTIINLVRNK